jgi:hypothetical protein
MRSVLTATKQGPPLRLFTTLDTFLVLAIGERAEPLLVERNAEGLGTGRRGLGVFGDIVVRSVPLLLL